ncbi:DMT family transporter [Parasulfitobacter algicola]|uniref:DMT family transporter n=1 Tax=Parasulfitobacter algicola TaxID=2614809 RepID=A0ABX2ITZ5_9RHOB|nr:DMT family transporter [Sulfitobacter algicola]NSX56387.1 DMT family transporter [Sulfitobacter algicola]
MDNLRGALLMIAAMVGFAIEDMFIKLMSDQLPTGQILAMLGLGGALIFATITAMQGRRLWSSDLLNGAVILRNLGEVIGTLGYVTAIVMTDLSSASTILQATPLVVTLGAALFLQEQVGWRRWLAIIVGFMGVLLVIRPGVDGFEPASLFAVQGAIGLAVRDIATRRVPSTISSMQLSTYGFAIIFPAGLMLMAFNQTTLIMPTQANGIYMSLALITGVLAYYAIVAAMRVGEVSFVTPFRYSRIVFAMILGILVFDEQPDRWVIVGAIIIVASGLFTVWRERRVGVSSSAPSR